MTTSTKKTIIPLVSIVVPCFNEERTIQLLLSALLKQTFPINDLEVIIADAFSNDKTRARIQEFTWDHPELMVKVIDNPKRTIPAAVNTAIHSSSGTIIIRLDAHSIPSPDYIRLCVDAIKAKKGDIVGGVWDIQASGEHWMAKSIAAAAAHPLGVGDALYRYTNQPGKVDTVPFGAFRRDLFLRIGEFDESLLTNEDYEFYTRVRKIGGKIWLDPLIRCVYYSRSTLGELARQYWRYGFWKFRMLIRYPDTIRWRQALPPLFVLTIIVLGILSIFLPLMRILLLMSFGSYLSALMITSLIVSIRKKQCFLFWGMPLAFMVMHMCWGAGFIYSMIARTLCNN